MHMHTYTHKSAHIYIYSEILLCACIIFIFKKANRGYAGFVGSRLIFFVLFYLNFSKIISFPIPFFWSQI